MKICTNTSCKKAGIEQPQESFTTQAGSSDGRASKCKKCLNAEMKAMRNQSKEKNIAYFVARQDTIELAIQHEKNKLLNQAKEISAINAERPMKGGACAVYARVFVEECKSALNTMQGLLT